LAQIKIKPVAGIVVFKRSSCVLRLIIGNMVDLHSQLRNFIPHSTVVTISMPFYADAKIPS